MKRVGVIARVMSIMRRDGPQVKVIAGVGMGEGL